MAINNITPKKRGPRMPYVTYPRQKLSTEDVWRWLGCALDIYYNLGAYDTPLRKGEWARSHQGDKFSAEAFFKGDRQVKWLQEESERERLELNNTADMKYDPDDPTLFRDQFGRLVETVPRSYRHGIAPGGVWMTRGIFRHAWKLLFNQDFYAIDHPERYEPKTVGLTAKEEAVLAMRGGYRSFRERERNSSPQQYSHPMDHKFNQAIEKGWIVQRSRGLYMVSEEMCDSVSLRRHHVWREHQRRYHKWEVVHSNVEKGHNLGERNWRRVIPLLKDLPAFEADHVVILMKSIGYKTFSRENALNGLSRLRSTGAVINVTGNLHRMLYANEPGLDGTLQNGPRRNATLGKILTYTDWLDAFVMLTVELTVKDPQHDFHVDDVIAYAQKRNELTGVGSVNKHSIYNKFLRNASTYQKVRADAPFIISGNGPKRYRLRAETVKALAANNLSDREIEERVREAFLRWLKPIQWQNTQPMWIMRDDCDHIHPDIDGGVFWKFIRDRHDWFHRMLMLPEFMCEDPNIPHRLKEAYYSSQALFREVGLDPKHTFEDFVFMPSATTEDGLDLAPFRAAVTWPTPHVDEVNELLGKMLG